MVMVMVMILEFLLEDCGGDGKWEVCVAFPSRNSKVFFCSDFPGVKGYLVHLRGEWAFFAARAIFGGEERGAGKGYCYVLIVSRVSKVSINKCIISRKHSFSSIVLGEKKVVIAVFP
jgi:hypothetical protein